MALVVLASASPRRRELLAQIGLPFEVVVTETDETLHKDETPGQYVERLARDKACAGLKLTASPGSLALGADTSVVLAGHVMGKPKNKGEACAMLQQLSGNTHQVMTAVALVSDENCHSCLVTTTVQFRDISENEITAYCQTGEPMDKAGAYGIQGLGGLFVANIAGSYSAVVGLPLRETADLLAQAGEPVWRYW
jgi:septum formation protein